MSCEKYRKAITEALASGEELPGSVRSHEDGCPACRAALAQEQALLAAIDTRIRDAVDWEVPGSFQAAVRVRIREEAMPKPNWVRTWAAVAASVAVILGIWALQNARHSGARPSPERPTLVRNPQQTETGALPKSSPRFPGGPTFIRRPSRGQDQRQSSVFVADLRPFVPAGQRQAVDQLIAGLQRGELKGEILLRENWNGPIEDLQISPIEVPPLPATSVDEGSPGIR